jgi:2-polyprenyl-3-methyl-5-hydroxy-6-metoxy-1,4-benzoquinol methylase
MLEAWGDVRGLRVLDCGCGEGRFCRMLVGRGVHQVVGVDLCPPLINAAARLATGNDTTCWRTHKIWASFVMALSISPCPT